MDNAIGMQVEEGQVYVMAEIHLNVVGKWFVGLFQESGETLIH